MKNMERTFILTIFLLTLVLIGCTVDGAGKLESQQEVPEEETLSYEVVYEEGDFKVREAFLGSLEDWQWEDFSMPQARIRNTVQDLGLRGACSTTVEFQASGWCTDTARMKTVDGKEHRFDLACDHIIGGHCLLKKNSKPIWEGDLSVVTCGPIQSSKRVGNEIAIDYVSIIPESQGGTINSILLTKGDAVVDIVEIARYDAAFAPNEIQGKLVYFASEHLPNGKVFLVFDDEEVSGYEVVFNQYCCWDGPPIQIFCNGEIVDFFAQKDSGWYHVQAGSF